MEKLHAIKLEETAKKGEDSIEELLIYYTFNSKCCSRIRTNNGWRSTCCTTRYFMVAAFSLSTKYILSLIFLHYFSRISVCNNTIRHILHNYCTHSYNAAATNTNFLPY